MNCFFTKSCGPILPKFSKLAIKSWLFFNSSSFKLEIRLVWPLFSVTDMSVYLFLPPLHPVLYDISLEVTTVVSLKLVVNQAHVWIIQKKLHLISSITKANLTKLRIKNPENIRRTAYAYYIISHITIDLLDFCCLAQIHSESILILPPI